MAENRKQQRNGGVGPGDRYIRKRKSDQLCSQLLLGGPLLNSEQRTPEMISGEETF